MTYKIIGDSSLDLPTNIIEDLKIDRVAFKINIDGKSYTDDETIELEEMKNNMYTSKNAPKTACPSAGEYLESYKDYDNLFVVTISSALSGSYNSASLARDLALEKNPQRKIHVFNSKSASIGQGLIALKIDECMKSGKTFEETIELVEAYINDLDTFFILESLDNLIKNGRLNKVKGMIASFLNIRPVMSDDGEGHIRLRENVRGKKKAFNRMVDIIGDNLKNAQEKILGIAHVDNLSQAISLKEEIKNRYNFKDIIITETRGLSTVYSDNGGVIVSF